VQVSEQVQYVVTRRDVHTTSWLIKQKHLRLSQKSAGQKHTLLLATGEFANVSLAKIADTQALEDCGNACLLWRTCPRSNPTGLTRHQNAFENRNWEIPTYGFQLWNVAHPQIWSSPNSARHRIQSLEQQPQECCFACTRWADNASELILVDVKRNVFEY